MDVIKKLRIKIVIGVIVIQTILLASILFSLIFLMSNREIKKCYEFLDVLIENEGHFPKAKLEDFEEKNNLVAVDINIDGRFKNYFSVQLLSNNEISRVIYDFPLEFTRDEISVFVNFITDDCKVKFGEVFSKVGIVHGKYGRIVYSILNKSDGTKFIGIMDISGKILTFYNLICFAVFIFIISFFISLLISILLSIFIVNPVKNAFIKQRQFIADAGHELKTPIAVIGANLDVLMPDMPDNRWLNYIKNENERMGELVKNLLYLARNDANRVIFQISSFNLSFAIKNAILPFESVAFEEKKQLKFEVAEDIWFSGDEQKIKQIAIILVDNAIKNSSVDALIRVSLKSDKDKIIFKVFNTGHGIKKDELEKIFLRFYRSDSSRARKTGGYGLGLAIAQSIAQLHKGSLTADSEEGQWAEFTLSLPIQLKKSSILLRILNFLKKLHN